MTPEIPGIDTSDEAFAQNLHAIDDAVNQARVKLNAMTEAASAAATTADSSDEEYSLHEVPGVGRYAVVRKTGWRPLLKVIHTPSANIDFGANTYPAFDGVIGRNFQSPYLLDPLNDKYESYRDLRDNIAAVRNFLMESYYVNTPPGMTPDKAKQALDEIAAFIGKGLDNNYRFLGVIPNHHSDKPFISLIEASATGGSGAQYIYEKILEMHRQSSWMRPFSAVIALFGGTPPPDWMLPSAHKTEFTDLFEHDIATGATAPTGPNGADLKAGAAALATLEATRQQLIDRHQMNNVAHDLDALGNYLLGSATNMQNVAQLAEPVRRDAIEIAKDILRKLRVSLGDIHIAEGLKLPPSDDVSALGAVKGVAMVYERMLGFARGLDSTIMQNATIKAATQAIGQMGYLAKIEALRMAKLAGNGKLAENLSGEIGRIPAAYTTQSEKKFSGLLDKVESGINTLMTRVQTISGPGAQINPGRQAGKGMNQAPTAGTGQQNNATGHNVNDAAKRNAELLAAENAHLQAQNTGLQKQLAARQKEGQGTGVVSRQTSGRQTLQQVRTTRQSTTTKTTAPGTPVTNPAQRQQNILNQSHLHHDQEEHEHDLLMKQRLLEMQRQVALQKQIAAKNAALKIDPGVLRGFQNATNTKGMGPTAGVKKPVPTVAPAPPVAVTAKPMATAPKPVTNQTPEEKNPYVPQPPNRGGGRGM